MQQIQEKELLTILNSYSKKDIMFKISGYVDLKMIFEKFEYKVNNDKICLQSGESTNYIVIDLKNVNFIGKKDKNVIFNLTNRQRHYD